MSGIVNKTGNLQIENQKLRRLRSRVYHLDDTGSVREADKTDSLYLQEVNGTQELFYSGTQVTSGKVIPTGKWVDKQGATNVLQTAIAPKDIDLQNKEVQNASAVKTTSVETNNVNLVVDESITAQSKIYKNGGDLYFGLEQLNNEGDILWEYDNVGKTRISAKQAGGVYPNVDLKNKRVSGALEVELQNQASVHSSPNTGYAYIYNIQPDAVYTKPYLYNQDKPVSPYRYYLDTGVDTYVQNYGINANNNYIQNVEGFATTANSNNVLNGTNTQVNSPFVVANASTLQSALVQNQLVNNGTFNQNGLTTFNQQTTFNAGYDAIFNGGVQINGGFSAGTAFNNHVDGRVNSILGSTTNIANFFTSTIDNTALPYNPGTYNVISANSRNGFDGVVEAKHIVANDDMACDIIYARDFVKKPSSSDFFDFIGSAGSGLLSIGAKTLGAMALTAGLVFAGGAVAMGALDTGNGEESLVVFNNAGSAIYPNETKVAEYYGHPAGSLGDYYYGVGYGAQATFHNELENSSKGDIQNAFSYGLDNWSNRLVINNVPVATEYTGNTKDYSAVAYYDGDLLDPDVKTKCYPCALGYTHEYFYSVGLKDYSTELQFSQQAKAYRSGSNHRTLQNLSGAHRLYAMGGTLHYNNEAYRKYGDTTYLYGIVLPPTNQSATPNDKLYQDLNNHLIWDGNRVIDAGNVGSFALPSTGGTLTGNLNFETTGASYKGRITTTNFGLSIQSDDGAGGAIQERIRLGTNYINTYNPIYNQYDVIFQNNNRGIYFQDGVGGRKLLTYSTLNNRLEFDGVSVASPFNQSGQLAYLNNTLLAVAVTNGQWFEIQNSFGTQGRIIATSGSTNGYILRGRANNTDGTQEDKILIDYQKIKFYEPTEHEGTITFNNNSTNGYTRGIVFDDSNTNKKIVYDNVNDVLTFDGTPLATTGGATFTEEITLEKGAKIENFLPSITSQKLYAVSDTLYWNGAQIGTTGDADKYFTLSGTDATSATGIGSYDFNQSNVKLTRGTNVATLSVTDTGTASNDVFNLTTTRDDITLGVAGSHTLARFKRFTNTPTNNQLILGEDNPWNLFGAFNRIGFKSANTAFIEAYVHNTTTGDANVNIQATLGTVALKTSFNNSSIYHSGTPFEVQAYTNTTNNYGDVIVKNRGYNGIGVVPWTRQGGLRFKDEQNGTGVYCMNLTNYGTPSLNLCYDTNYNEVVSFINRTNASQIDFNSAQSGTGNNYNLHLGTWNGLYGEYYLYGTHSRFAVGLQGGNITFHLTSSGWANVSDRRIKSNIQEVSDEKTIKFIEKATPKTYTLRKKFHNQLGFVAQDVEELGDEFVEIGEDYIDIPVVSGKKQGNILQFTKPHGLQTGGNYINAVRFWCENDENPYDYKFKIEDKYTIRLEGNALCQECKEEKCNIRITGQKVNDFRSVNYTTMAVMTQRAVQYLYKNMNKQTDSDKDVKIATLTYENQQLRERLDKVESILLKYNMK
jgi:hypothetical protein